MKKNMGSADKTIRILIAAYTLFGINTCPKES